MTKTITFILLLCTFGLFAQSSKLNYQALLRDGSNTPIVNTNVGLQISILQNSPTGTVVYSETQNVATNQNGLVTITIGNEPGFDTIDWSNGTHFIKVEVDPTGGVSYSLTTTNAVTSVPYSLYAETAATAETADYNNLSNTPTTISTAQATKIDFIAVTAAVDLDQMKTDVAVNTAKTSFPGFGTTAGTVLEGNNPTWTKDASDNLFYNGASVGIGVPQGSDFSGSKLHVGGAMLFDGVTTEPSVPGSLFYDATTGTFNYINNSNTKVTLNAGNVTQTTSIWSYENGDAITSSDVIGLSSIGIGVDMNTGEDFGFKTVLLKENNLRIFFDDSDDPNGTNPANDWEIEINAKENGGTSHFAINDVSHSTTPFKILAGAPENSLFINASGNVGLGTNTPSENLEVNGNIKATHFIGDGSGLTGITGATGGISNDDDTIIAADTNVDTTGEISFQTKNTPRMTITNEGKIGIGTTSPSVALEVMGSAKTDNLNVDGTFIINNTLVLKTNTDTSSDTFANVYNVADKSFISLNSTNASTIDAFENGIEGQIITINNSGTENITFTHNSGTASQNFQLPNDANIVLTLNSSATFIFNGTNWYCIGLAN